MAENMEVQQNGERKRDPLQECSLELRYIRDHRGEIDNLIDIPAAMNIIEECINNDHYMEMLLPVVQFQFWYDAIYNDNVIFVKELLSQCDAFQQTLFMNGRFRYDKQPFMSKQKENEKKHPMLELPLFLAVYYQSNGVLDVLMKLGADVLKTDIEENNLIHCIVLSSSWNSGKGYMELYNNAIHHVTYEEKNKLLMSENEAGLRPLELAAHLNAYAIQECILQTRGIYAHSKGYCGVHELVYYDVTDYECFGEGNRCLKSPLWYLTHVSNKILARDSENEFLLSPVIMSWCSLKENNTRHIIWLWFVFRAFFYSMVVVASGYFNEVFSYVEHYASIDRVIQSYCMTPNCTLSCKEKVTAYNFSTCERKIVTAYLCEGNIDLPELITVFTVVLLCCIIFISDVIYWIVSHSKRYCTARGADRKVLKGGPLMSTHFYSNAQSLLAFCVTATAVLMILGKYYNIPLIVNLGVGFYICVILLNVWALLFFFQFLPHIGYFVVAVQRMIGDTLKFFIIYALFLIGFSEAFDNVLTLNGFCSGTGFENKVMSLYTTFTTMFDMLDGDSFPDYVKENFTVGLVHILYVMLVGVLLMNFIIAIMSDTITSVSDNKATLMTLQGLHVHLLLEYTLSPICCCWYKKRQGMYLVREEGRLYLPCFVTEDDLCQTNLKFPKVSD